MLSVRIFLRTSVKTKETYIYTHKAHLQMRFCCIQMVFVPWQIEQAEIKSSCPWRRQQVSSSYTALTTAMNLDDPMCPSGFHGAQVEI